MWQLIETAPKDGTSILGWFPTVDGAHRMWWNGRHLKAYGSGWIYGNGSGVELPTHWMPLPEPPKEEGK